MKYSDSSPIYNSRIIKVFIEYLKKKYPEVDIDIVLDYSGINRQAVDDQAHWFNQTQTDRFYEIMVKETKNPHIAREAGRYAISSGAMAAAQQYTIGLMGLSYVYRFMGKLYNIVSRGATVKAKKLGPNKVEIISTPNPGVNEKSYICENRIGTFEAIATLFTEALATVEHPECYHEGGQFCRYIISWEKTSSMLWKRVRNIFLLFIIVASVGLFPVFPLINWLIFLLLGWLILAGFSLYAAQLETKELTRVIETQGDVSGDLLDEIEIRHNNSLFVQEVGQALSRIMDVDALLDTVVNIMVRRMDFDRGLIMLANSEKTRLVFNAGYGYNGKKEQLLRNTEFHLDRAESQGPFVLAFQEQQPCLINDIKKIKNNLSAKSLELVNELGVRSMICVPILFEKESLGILAVDNVQSKKPFTESDMHLLMGVASQTAVGIVNTRSFNKVQENEKKYRDLVESANSIILRMDVTGNITFFNEFAQEFFGHAEHEILGRNIKSTLLPNSDSDQ
ncbi:GAF domain-containing protein, partial [Thermodesulfobacteriota bacterium]